MWTVLLMWSHPSSLSLSLFPCASPNHLYPNSAPNLNSWPCFKISSASGWTTGMHDSYSPAQRTHSDEFLSPSTADLYHGTKFSDLWFLLWCPAPTQSPLSPTHPQEGSSQIWLLGPQAAVTCFTQQDTENFSSPLSPFQSHLKLLSPLHQEVGFIWLVCFD